MPKILDQISHPNDIKNVDPDDYKKLAAEIRKFLVTNISKTGGHLASNLGVVELTMALHLFLQFPDDKLVWDVGHQAYVHKILTGRKNDFASLRQYEGMSGFPKRKESDCDAFDTGHSSTSLSVAAGLVKARELSGGKNKVVAVIGDGALSGGMAFEALNNLGRSKSNLIIILNDNNMSISENVGGLSSYLGKVRTNKKYTGFKDDLEASLKKIPKVGDFLVSTLKQGKESIKHLFIPGMLFEDMGITYIGPIDGHNIRQMQIALNAAARKNTTVLIHVVTKKGKGYELAEQNPSRFHGVEPFDIETGQVLKKNSLVSYTKAFSDAMLALGKENDKVVAITAAMPDGTGLTPFAEKYPDRFFDVGIAEQHAVTFAAGMASLGYRPVVAIYSTFLQRAYDQIVHDVCVGMLPVVFAIDRAGIVGKDGETHQGLFDLSFLNHIPQMTIMAPKHAKELKSMLYFAVGYQGPIAIRYPRSAVCDKYEEVCAPVVYGKSEVIKRESQICLLAVGSMFDTACQVYDKLKKQGKQVSLINVRFVKPFDKELLYELSKDHSVFVTMEENVKTGGYGETVSVFLCENKLYHVTHINISLPDTFIEHGERDELLAKFGEDAEDIVKKINDLGDNE